MLDDQTPDHDGQTTSGLTSTDPESELAALLCHALDGDDPVRISLLTRLALGMYADCPPDKSSLATEPGCIYLDPTRAPASKSGTG